jgi:hypothetical protein
VSATCPSDELKERVGDVPIYTHVRLLGVDIGVKHLQQRCDMHDVRYPLARSRDTVDIRAVGSDTRLKSPDRRYLAAWVRRSLNPATEQGDQP